MDRIDPRDMRAGDPDREHTADILRRAAGEGRIDIDELEERLERAYRAKTYRELSALVADLPDGTALSPAAAALAPSTRAEPLQLKATMSDVERSGTWAVPPRIHVSPAMGNVKLDFRNADCPHRLVEIEVKGGTGNVVLILPKGWAVDADQLRTGWGSVKNRREGSPSPDGVLVRVTGGIGMGSLVARDPHFYEK
ncbi:DUF1707 domain-containing protein [Mumia zhuanghuii]|uniref:DUF1707 domain-containing protein n=2 Tax=Mumia TaxID=1546255 RepID=A0ABW1QGL7_9ACTN|nr:MULTISPECIES: DUF1707 domain-containing protein [Mumia]KAA1424743.1 DUF1707 domain-containing protein [Mumia zhuanghuii]